MDILKKAALAFQKISDVNYEFVSSTGRKLVITSISVNKGDFTHIVGLDHLTDIWQLVSHNTKTKESVFRKILADKITYEYLSKNSANLLKKIPGTLNPYSQNEYTIADRISKVGNIDALMDSAYLGKIYKWNPNKCNVIMPNGKKRLVSIKADYLLKVPLNKDPVEYMYLFTYQENKTASQTEPIKLSIFSVFADGIDLTVGQEKPYTILEEKKINIKTKEEELLFRHPNYTPENDSFKSTLKEVSDWAEKVIEILDVPEQEQTWKDIYSR